MRLLIFLLTWFYRQMLRLYPVSYRELFAEEMESTFRRRLEESDGRSLHRLLLLFLREVRDLPSSLVHAHRNQHENRQAAQYAAGSL
jgi:hypothetical protein